MLAGYDNLPGNKKIMKDLIVRFSVIYMISASLGSCHSSGSNHNAVQDTAVRTATDTVVILGTPGPSGTEPRAGDTTQAHRDSLKRAANISDSAGKASSKP
jgi:hypothetical protein